MNPPKLIDQVRDAIRVRHYSIRTEEAYIQWIKRYIFFHNKKHPRAMGEAEITSFLTHLAVDKHVAASTQNQALSALLFLYKEVLGVELDWLEDVVRARRPQRLPVVLTVSKVKNILSLIPATNGLIACLLYGTESIKDKGWYTGYTSSLKRRLSEHNSGYTKSIRHKGPWRLSYYEACLSLDDAVAREKYLKSGMGKRYTRNRLKVYFRDNK